MGRKLSYQPGSYYVTDDRTGFPQRAERTRKEWTGLRVDESVWEARQPQDLVRGVKDDQTVPDARPLAPNIFKGPTYVQLTANAAIGATTLQIESTAGFFDGARIGVMLDAGMDFNTTCTGLGAGFITIAKAMPNTAASGNLVTNYTENISVRGVTP